MVKDKFSAMKTQRIGVISDTHGLLRPEAIKALRGSEAIIHAGDVGDAVILEKLAKIAPVTAIRGNIDTAPWAKALPETDVLQLNNNTIYLIHNVKDLDLDPHAAGLAAVIFGHTHQPLIETRNRVLFFNPGSAGPRRFKLPISVGRLTLKDGSLRAEVIEL
jgi:putative phosphoesterase